jgi:pimeloyl-ACP methyl ester carboxylesterase
MPKVRANGIDIYYEDNGVGEPLLLIAGFACDLSIWSKVASSLITKYRVIVFDNRGIGRSSAPDSTYSIRQMAEDAGGLLDAIGIGRAHVAGHSMGGQIAQELALMRPEMISSLILLASCAKTDARNEAIISSWGELPRQVDPAAAARLSLPWIYTDHFYARPGAIQQVIDLTVANPFPPTAHGIFHQSRAVTGFNSSGRLRDIACPTLIVVGNEDLMLPVPFSEKLFEEIRSAELVVLAKTGHGFLIESSDEVAAVMQTFLSKHADR